MSNSGVEALSTVLANYQNGGTITQAVTSAVTAAENFSIHATAYTCPKHAQVSALQNTAVLPQFVDSAVPAWLLL